MVEWEYRIVCLCTEDGSERERLLNIYGREGWELVSVTAEDEEHFPVAYFKRAVKPKQEGENR